MYIIKMCKDKSLLVTRSQPIYQGENNSDTIDFFIPKEYDQKDISEASVRLNYLLPNGVSGYIYLNKDEDDYDNFSLYHFVVTTMFTHFAGRVVFWLTLLKDEELTILQTSQGYFDVIEKIDVDYGTHGEHEVDERLIQIQNLQADTIRQLSELREMIIGYDIPSITLKVDNLISKVDVLEEQCNILIETKLDISTANELVSEQKDMLNVLEQQLNSLQANMDNISNKIDKTFTQKDRQIFENLQTKVATQQRRIQTLESNMTIETRRLDATQILVTNNTDSINDTSTTVEQLTKSVNTNKSDINQLNQSVSDNRNDINSIFMNVTQLTDYVDNNINDINERLDDLEQSIEQPITTTSIDIQSEPVVLNTQTTSITSNVQIKPTTLNTQVMSLSDIEQDTLFNNSIIENTYVGVLDTDTLNTHLTQMRAVIGEIQSNIIDINTGVNNIQTKVGKLQNLETQNNNLYNLRAVSGDID